MFRIQTLQEVVEFHLLRGSENRANACVDVLANGIVLGLGLRLTLLVDSHELLVRSGKNHLHLTPLLGSQMQLSRETIEYAFTAGKFIHMAQNHCAEAANEAAEQKHSYYQDDRFRAGSITGHERYWMLSGVCRSAPQVARRVR